MLTKVSRECFPRTRVYRVNMTHFIFERKIYINIYWDKFLCVYKKFNSLNYSEDSNDMWGT